MLEFGRSPRVALFKLFTKLWKSVGLNASTETLDNARPPEQRLANLTPLPRQAFLLMALEGFSARPSRFSFRSTTAARTFVPPRSIPITCEAFAFALSRV